jgi:hypothetical protein
MLTSVDPGDPMVQPNNAHQPLAKVIIEPAEVSLELAKMGLSRAPLIEASLMGDLHRRTCTGLDVASAPGFYLWSRALRVLREQTARELQWHPGDYLQIPVTYNNDESIAVAVSSGDDRTGRSSDADPATKNLKGFATVDAVANNKLVFGKPIDEQAVDFWYLLIDAGDEGVWIEVSRPTFVDGVSQRVTGWSHRIVIGRVDQFDDGGAKRRPPIAPVMPDIDVPVTRRRSA